ncbi:MAG: hypothetical protein A2289_09870 [Deltaproteobacteria bacterium RIFOXYA12_FULL_58_15]|nr:MAG: hypothetical protein A2289_09870 [Deltaproteobacteria bacterium RIFOXYA12_FULL_58_15]OGR13514.1 MAG: hypothetical protein A2341_26220 [Deltaproteobacteria bacterium RIFOXYB12_FULL_58_9]
MEELFRAIREACSPATWSKGVLLARGGGVVPSRSDGHSIEVRITTKGSLVARAVLLYPEDEDWQCECESGEDACEHVAAAVIAVHQARKQGDPSSATSADAEGVHDQASNLTNAVSPASSGRLGYRLDRDGDELHLRRVIVTGRKETTLYTSLTVAAKGHEGTSFVTNRQDLAIDKACAGFTGGGIPTPQIPSLFEALIDAPDLTYNGKAAQIGEPSSGLCLHVEDCAEGFRLRLEQDSVVDEIFRNGVLRKGSELSPVCPHGINERLFHELRRGKVIPRHQANDLVAGLLPDLEKKIRVIVDSATLPHADTVPVRLHLHSTRQQETLVVFPSLVYGEPPRARVVGESLTLLGEFDVPRRNYREEERLRQLLLRELELEVGVEKRFTGRHALNFAGRLRDFDNIRVIKDGGGEAAFYLTARLAPHLRADDDGRIDVWFAPTDEAAVGGTRRAAASAVLRAWQQGDEHAPLLQGGFGSLPHDWLNRFGPRLADLLAARGANDAAAPVPAFAFADVIALCQATGQETPQTFRHLENLVRDFAGIPMATPPGDVTATLRSYQRDGVNWLSFLRDAHLGGLLADDMGLGKTLQALCAIRGRTLVVAPRSVLHNWQTEIQRFRPKLSAHIYHGPNRNLDTDAEIILTTYAVLRLDADTLAGRHWDTVVLDESQAIKNPQSQISRAAFRLKADFRIALTGTPVENRLDDLWSQFQFINAGLLSSHADFQEQYVRPIANSDQDAAARLRERIRPFVLRRLKRDVALELPPRTELVLTCELDESERAVYDAVKAATRAEVVAALASGTNTLAILEALLRLRQAACHPSLVPGQGALANRSSSKLDLLLNTLDEANLGGHKSLVFSQWTSLLDRVEPHLRQADLDFVRLDGTTRDRQGVVDAFQAPDGPPVMLLSLKAGGTGLNLTAADHVFLLDPWWNPAVEDQAADRAHRIGQDKPVFIHRLIAADTVEERILALQQRKRDLAATAIGDAAAASSITREDLLALLQ